MDDTAFAALADADRRELLSLLAATMEGDPPVRVPDDLILGPPDSPRAATRLHHVHLPKLTAMDYVEWDAAEGVVRRGPAFEELEPLLEVLQEHEGMASD
jgi:hypothetical protein